MGLVLVIGCSKKTVPAASQTTSPEKKEAPKNEVKTEQAKTDAQIQADIEGKRKEEARQAETSPATSQKPSDDVSGRTVYAAKCSKCHGLKEVSAYTYNQWESILKTMVPRAKLSSDEESQVLAFIRANAK